MFWYPAKGAFRAGAVVSNSTSWDDSNIGQDSFAAGQDCEANGQWSMRLGVNNIASGISAIAIGTSATASNNGAVALGGGGTQASGVNSFAASGGFALADDSFALGGGNIGQARVDSGATGGIAIGNAEVSGAFSNAFGTVVPSGTNPTVSGLNSTGFFLGDQSGSVLSGNGSAAFLLGGQAGTPVTAAQDNSFVVLGGNAGFWHYIAIAGALSARQWFVLRQHLCCGDHCNLNVECCRTFNAWRIYFHRQLDRRRRHQRPYRFGKCDNDGESGTFRPRHSHYR